MVVELCFVRLPSFVREIRITNKLLFRYKKVLGKRQRKLYEHIRHTYVKLMDCFLGVVSFIFFFTLLLFFMFVCNLI